MSHLVVLCTCPKGESAEQLAKLLVEERLAACVNILSDVTSVYVWQGTMEKSKESLLLIKTERSAYERLQARLRERHPYELPEIVAVPIERGLPDYLNWVSQCLKPPSD